MELATRTRLYVDSLDAWLMAQPSLVNSRKKAVLPVLRERLALQDSTVFETNGWLSHPQGGSCARGSQPHQHNRSRPALRIGVSFSQGENRLPYRLP